MRSVITLALVLAACDDPADALAGLVVVSGASPFSGDCITGTGANFRDAEVEPSLAVDPRDPQHLIGAWQQDRWSNGGANGIVVADSRDGGATWTTSTPPLSRCAAGEYARASDPWVAITADGRAFVAALAFDSGGKSAILVSAGDGVTWSAPSVLRADIDEDVLNDKPSLTASGDQVYAVWDRVTGLLQPSKPIGTGPTFFARATAGAWEPARTIFDPGVDAQTIGNQIVVLPDGTLVDMFCLITSVSAQSPITRLAVIRSVDQGATWSAPIIVAPMQPAAIAKRDIGVRAGDVIPEIAVDRAAGTLAIVWQDGFGTAIAGIAMALSTDAGLTWTPPQQVNADPGHAAFDPMVAITSDHVLGLTYYDTRDDDASAAALHASNWLATSPDNGTTWTEERLAGPFDLTPARLGGDYFLGDYQGLVASGSSLVPFFTVAHTAADPTQIVVRP